MSLPVLMIQDVPLLRSRWLVEAPIKVVHAFRHKHIGSEMRCDSIWLYCRYCARAVEMWIRDASSFFNSAKACSEKTNFGGVPESQIRF